MLRLFMDACRSQKLSCGVVFLDIRTAYYKVLRELVARQDSAHGRLQGLLHAFNLPPESLRHLECKLAESSYNLQTHGAWKLFGNYAE